MTMPNRCALLIIGLAFLAGPAAAEGAAELLQVCDPAHRAAATKGEAIPAGFPASLREQYATEIDNVSTFKALGLDQAAADQYLATPPGRHLLDDLTSADAKSDPAAIRSRAEQQLNTGSDAPHREPLAAALVKIVPKGQSVSPYSPYFTTVPGLEAACRSKLSLADSFALPIKSEAASYDVYEITPGAGPADTFVSPIAPTSELGGIVRRPGGAKQYLVPNRGSWSAPTLLGTIAN